MSLRERVLCRIRQELALHETSAPRKWFPLSREAILYPALLAEAQRQVEEHTPDRRHMGDPSDPIWACNGCEDVLLGPDDNCGQVLAWARVFGEGE